MIRIWQSYGISTESEFFSIKWILINRLKKQYDTIGKVDIYTYDNSGRVLIRLQQNQSGNEPITVLAKYDKNGNKRFETDGNGVTRENTYDGLNRLTSTKITVGGVAQTTAYSYDANGNQEKVTDWLGNTYTNIYDPINRLIEKKDPYTTIQKLTYYKNSLQNESINALGKKTVMIKTAGCCPQPTPTDMLSGRNMMT